MPGHSQEFPVTPRSGDVSGLSWGGAIEVQGAAVEDR